jgi:predicted lipoprotein with Yx(FWY)xxD motif
MMLFRRCGRFAASFGATALLSLGLVSTAPQFSAAANADTASCADATNSAPTGPATVSATSTPYGKVLVEGSGDHAGCSLYVLSSDQLRALSGADFACSNGDNPLHASCDAILWPALLTDGAPIAGPGVNPTLLGTVNRSDILTGQVVQQVTYAGLPLYRFLFDEDPGEMEGANLFDPVTSPTGIWYLVDPSRGAPATGPARLQSETIGDQTVVSVTVNDHFSVFANASFPVYTSSADSGHSSVCQAQCAAVDWPPVLTSGRPQAGPGVDQHSLGTIVRSDGTEQATLNGKPLYLHDSDAYIGGVTGKQGITGDGANTAWGVFHTIPNSS